MVLAFLLCILIFVATCLFFSPPAWFPSAISSFGLQYDRQFQFTLLVCGFIFLAAHLILVFLILKYRKNGGAALYTHGSRRAEFIWTGATMLLFTGLALSGTRIWAGVHFVTPPPNTEVIEVYAHQFAWRFRYPGPDGKFGRTEIRLINDAAENPMGLDEHDPAALDDIISASLKIPAGKDITLLLHARDVIHDFFVRELRLKQDVVPGMEIPYRFRAWKTGIYEIACSELCGLGHSQMRGVMEVMLPSDFERWKQTHARR